MIANNDQEGIYAALKTCVYRSSAVRTACENRRVPMEYLADDILQTLALNLFQKDRYSYYTKSRMTDGEIEAQIAGSEIKMLVRLRDIDSESSRIAKRIKIILQTDPRFELYVQNNDMASAITNQVYALSDWKKKRTPKAVDAVGKVVSTIAPIERDFRGARGGSKLIVSNPLLANLLEEVLFVVDTPLSCSEITAAALTRVSVFDVSVYSLNEGWGDENEEEYFPENRLVSKEKSAHQELESKEHLNSIYDCIGSFF